MYLAGREGQELIFLCKACLRDGHIIGIDRDAKPFLQIIPQWIIGEGRNSTSLQIAGRTHLQRNPARKNFIQERRVFPQANTVTDSGSAEADGFADALGPRGLAGMYCKGNTGLPCCGK